MKLRNFGVFAVGIVASLANHVASPDSLEDRFAPIRFEDLTPKQKGFITAGVDGKPVAAHDIDKKNTNSLYYVLIRSPDLAQHLLEASSYLRDSLPRKLSEIAILLTARHWTSQYMWSKHSKLAAKYGVSSEIIDAIAVGRRPASMEPDEVAVYDFCTELRGTGRVPGTTFVALKNVLGGDKGMVDMVALLGFYDTSAMFMAVSQFPIPGGAQPVLKPLQVAAGPTASSISSEPK